LHDTPKTAQPLANAALAAVPTRYRRSLAGPVSSPRSSALGAALNRSVKARLKYESDSNPTE
jgi:hypothetical protein